MRPMRDTPLTALVLAACVALSGALRAQETGLAISDLEARDPPTAARLKAIQEQGTAQGWGPLVNPLREAAERAFEQNRFVAADGWFNAYRWSALFSEPKNVCVTAWVKAIEAAQLNYAGVGGSTYNATDKPMATYLTPEVQAWVVSNPEFSSEFFSNLKAVDRLQNVLGILDGLYRRNPEAFARYSSLALAIALVYDVPPPPNWPHSQVSPESLPRKLPNPAFTYERLMREDRLGHTFFRLTQMKADELKFVVDTAAPESELNWAEASVPVSLDQLEVAYRMIRYRTDRASDYAKMVWAGGPYTLQAILLQGGICVDQAYFATEVGKARGVPTLFFGGEGQGGRHAWFGFLDSTRKWRLDAGRYAEQRLVTGHALDPQTWMEISDHEIQFLSERFRLLPSFAQSRVQEEFAEDFMQRQDFARAARAARSAVNFERRNLNAWETLLAANAQLNLDPSRQEAVMREAALAYTPRYPDLVVWYTNRICQSLRARGEISRADYEERGLAARFRGERADLSIQQASGILSRSIATQPIQDQIATYNAILSQFGHGAGTQFFDQIVTSFAEHLSQGNLKPQAREAIERARVVLEAQPGTTLYMDMDKLLSQMQD